VAAFAVGTHHGEYFGSPTLGAAGLLASGNSGDGGAVSFDGRDDSMTAQVNPTASAFTLEAIVRLRDLPNGATFRYVLFSDDEYGKSGFRFGVGAEGQLWFWTSESGGETDVVSPLGALAPQKTAHVAVTRSPSEVVLYIDGVEVARGPSDVIPSPPPLDIAAARGSHHIAAVVDEVAFYDHVVTRERLAAHARAAFATSP
jgi:hypothetical protein